MYPSRELTALALRKRMLRQRIAVARWECVALASDVARPIALVDRAIVQWRKISPLVKFAALPLGLLFRRRLIPASGGFFRKIVRWAPVALSAMRMFKGQRV